jgi:DNA-binding NtrC family response regulator
MAKKTLPGVLILSQDQIWQAVVCQALEDMAEILFVCNEIDLMDIISIQQIPVGVLLIDIANFSDITTLLEFVNKWKSKVAVVVIASVPSWRDARELLLSGVLDYIRKSEIVDDIRLKLMPLVSNLNAGIK